MKHISVLILILSIFLSSCASVFNSRFQKVVINADDDTEILINGEEPIIKNGKYKLKRNLKPKQITFKSEGFKDENIVLMQYKRPWLYYVSWVPFGVLFLIPPVYDKGFRAYDYDSEVSQNSVASIAPKTADQKDIRINKISVNLKKENIKYRYFQNYKYYLRKEHKKDAETSDTEKELNIENTIFSGILNEILEDKGYIDTTRKALGNSYLNNLLINASIEDYTVHHIATNAMFSSLGGMIYIDLSVKWEVLDFYEKTIYEKTTKNTSGQFAILDYNEKDNVIENAIKDVMENGLIDFMNSEKVDKLLKDKKTLNEEESFSKIIMPAPDTTVSNLPQAIKSSLTVKTKKGFGSGFVISSNGYIITNYHVIADSTNLKVVLNNGNEHKVKVIRVSKIHDLALLKIDVQDLIPFALNASKDIPIATEVYAVGTPTAEDLSQTISKGIISGIRNNANGSKLIQTDASINSGNSGGPLVTKEGLVYGVVSSKIKGFSIEGVAFGIPAYDVIEKLNIDFQ